MRNTATILVLLVVLSSVFCPSSASGNQVDDVANEELVITFEEEKHKFREGERRLISNIIVQSEKEVRALLPTLPKGIQVRVSITEEEVNRIGGVNGRTESNTPAEIMVEVSRVFPGGISAAINSGLSALIFHEFHHLSRGWAIKDNKYGQGISIAIINEGLAVVFSETYTGVLLEGNRYPKDVDKWVPEILALPKNADYGKWMFKHPDGRSMIGYRTGNYIIRRAIANSGKNILELSKLTPDEIWDIVKTKTPGLSISFDEENFEFSESEKQLIIQIIQKSEKGVRVVLPTLPRDISVSVTIIDREIDIVGGVSGRADAPGEVLIELSNVFPGGIVGAAKGGLSASVYHEFHHLYRGWTIRENKFGQGISIAVVNEGLAVVFSEIYTGVKEEGNRYPKEVDKWVPEIMALPKDADYGKWMFQHPDGRIAIGYKTGNYLIREAISKSGKNILELGKLDPDEIYRLAGVSNK